MLNPGERVLWRFEGVLYSSRQYAEKRTLGKLTFYEDRGDFIATDEALVFRGKKTNLRLSSIASLSRRQMKGMYVYKVEWACVDYTAEDGALETAFFARKEGLTVYAIQENTTELYHRLTDWMSGKKAMEAAVDARPQLTSLPSLVLCPGCRATIPGDAVFCGKCGMDLRPRAPAVPPPAAPAGPRHCASCGAAVSSNTRFCPACGGRVA